MTGGITTRSDDGSASVLAIGLMAASVILAFTLGAISSGTMASQRAAHAADAAALAAVDAQSGFAAADACEAARTLATENGAEVMICEQSGDSFCVQTAVRHLGLTFTARARAAPGGPSE